MLAIEPINTELLWTFAGVVFALSVGSVVRFVALRRSDTEIRSRRLASLRTWWILTIVFTTSLMLGTPGLCVLFAVASGIALWEYTRLLGSPRGARAGVILVSLIAFAYSCIAFNETTAFAIGTPLLAGFLTIALSLPGGSVDTYIRRAGGLLLGLGTLVYGLAHVPFLMTIVDASPSRLGPHGWVLYLVILTESNDIAQALVGRRFGVNKRHRITPTISPNKTWEGFIGGAVVTVLLALALAPWMTSLTQTPVSLGSVNIPSPIVAGLLIPVFGFIGDINMSAVKRDAGVKDSGRLLAGMGGVIDRVDSLTLTAPAFTYFTWWVLA